MMSINEINQSILEKKHKYEKFSSEQLKMVALIFMIIDHIGYCMGDKGIVLRYIGRLSFPVFAFLIVEGFKHTSDRVKYVIRMIGFAAISEIPFNLLLTGNMFYRSHQNVMFTYALALIMLGIIDYIRTVTFDYYKASILEFTVVIGICAISLIFRTDYYVLGPMLIWIFYRWDEDYIATFIMALMLFIIGMEITAIFSLIIIFMYNGKKSNRIRSQKMAVINKYFFYIAYPLHMLVLWIVRGIVA